MKKQLFLLICILISNYAISQISAEDIVGKWKVIKIVNKMDDASHADLIKSFGSALFEFKENSDFKLSTSENTKLFSMVINMTNNSQWRFSTNESIISIGSEFDNFSILEIMVVELDGKTIFKMYETELELEVEKQ